MEGRVLCPPLHTWLHIQSTPRLLFFTGEFKRMKSYFPTPSLENRTYRYRRLSSWCSCYRKYSDVSEVREKKTLTILSNAGLWLNRQQAPFWICISGKCGDTLQKNVATRYCTVSLHWLVLLSVKVFSRASHLNAERLSWGNRTCSCDIEGVLPLNRKTSSAHDVSSQTLAKQLCTLANSKNSIDLQKAYSFLCLQDP